MVSILLLGGSWQTLGRCQPDFIVRFCAEKLPD